MLDADEPPVEADSACRHVARTEPGRDRPCERALSRSRASAYQNQRAFGRGAVDRLPQTLEQIIDGVELDWSGRSAVFAPVHARNTLAVGGWLLAFSVLSAVRAHLHPRAEYAADDSKYCDGQQEDKVSHSDTTTIRPARAVVNVLNPR